MDPAAVSALVTAGATVVLVVVTAIYAAIVRSQQRIMEQQLREAHDSRLDSLRPVVVVSARRTRLGEPIFDIANVGPGPALDLEVTLDRWARVSGFLEELDVEGLGGFLSPCTVLPAGKTVHFWPPAKTGVNGRYFVKATYESVYKDVGRFELEQDINLPTKE